jgi:hypothetical protein
MGDLKPFVFPADTRVCESLETKSSTIDSKSPPERRLSIFKNEVISSCVSLTDDPLNSPWKLVKGRTWVKLDNKPRDFRSEEPDSILPVSPVMPNKSPERSWIAVRNRRLSRQIQAEELASIATLEDVARGPRRCKLFKEVPRKSERKLLKAGRY